MRFSTSGMPNLTEVADRLEMAADYLRVHGHHRGEMFEHVWVSQSATPPACAIGALIAPEILASGRMIDPSVDYVAQCAAHCVIEHLYHPTSWHLRTSWRLSMGGTKVTLESLAQWNDRIARTADEVIEAFLATAKAIRNGEIT